MHLNRCLQIQESSTNCRDRKPPFLVTTSHTMTLTIRQKQLLMEYNRRTTFRENKDQGTMSIWAQTKFGFLPSPHQSAISRLLSNNMYPQLHLDKHIKRRRRPACQPLEEALFHGGTNNYAIFAQYTGRLSLKKRE